MKVKFTMPIRGTLQLQHAGEIVFPDMVFRFVADSATGFVDRLELEVLNVPQDKWPTLIKVEQDPKAKVPRFPFNVNPNAIQLTTYVPQIINLESILSVFGLEEIDIASTKHEWITEPSDEQVGILQGMAPGERKPEPFAEPLSDETLARAVVASNGLESETGGLAHFRAGLALFHATRYIDAVRYFYLCIEYLYAQGHHNKKQTLLALNSASQLVASIDHTLSSVTPAKAALQRLSKKYPQLAGSVTAEVFIDWMFHLRGNIQHGNPKSPTTWHPSRQRDFEQEAVLLLNIAYDVCWEISIARLRAVQP